ncbi:MAG: hypothetical protein RSF90_06180, partial [Pygmaiobacter sp.]
ISASENELSVILNVGDQVTLHFVGDAGSEILMATTIERTGAAPAVMPTPDAETTPTAETTPDAETTPTASPTPSASSVASSSTAQ